MSVQLRRFEALDELLRVAMAVRRHVEEVGARHGLTGPQARLLLALEEPMRMHAAAQATACEPSHLTALAEQLERTGLLARETDPADRRARRLLLTERGTALRAELVPAVLDGAPVVSRLSGAACGRLTELLRTASPA